MSAQPHTRLPARPEATTPPESLPHRRLAVFGGVITVRRAIGTVVSLHDRWQETSQQLTSGALGYFGVEVSIDGKQVDGSSGMTDITFGSGRGTNVLIAERNQLVATRQQLYGPLGGITFDNRPMAWQLMEALSKPHRSYDQFARGDDAVRGDYDVVISYGEVPESGRVEVDFATKNLQQMGRLCLSR